MRIALTGGIACGKSTLAKFLRELGIRLLDADDVVHELEAPGGAAVPAIVARFGAGVLAADGSVDRPKLAGIVFADAAARRDLEAILFPLVRSRLRAFTSEAARRGRPPSTAPAPPSTAPAPPSTAPVSRPPSTVPLYIAIIPLLFESHWEGDYDIILAITSPLECQIHRMMRTRGYSRVQAEARLAAQMPVAEKAARADFVVVNDSTHEHLKDEARRLVAWLKERAKYEQ